MNAERIKLVEVLRNYETALHAIVAAFPDACMDLINQRTAEFNLGDDRAPFRDPSYMSRLTNWITRYKSHPWQDPDLRTFQNKVFYVDLGGRIVSLDQVKKGVLDSLPRWTISDSDIEFPEGLESTESKEPTYVAQ